MSDIVDRLRELCDWLETDGHDDGLAAAQSTARDAIAAIEQLRHDLTAYHRRAQQAEAAIVAQHGNGPSLGRSLANAGYRHWQERAQVAEAALIDRPEPWRCGSCGATRCIACASLALIDGVEIRPPSDSGRADTTPESGVGRVAPSGGDIGAVPPLAAAREEKKGG